MTTTVILICGLPAAGKSFIASKLIDMMPSLTKYIEYDGLEEVAYQRLRNDSIKSPENSLDDDTKCRLEAWNQAREMALEELESCLTLSSRSEKGAEPDQIILIDDNFHLRGMRKQIHRLLLRSDFKNLKFGILWVDQPLNICLERNRSRSKQIPEETIRKLHANMELPRVNWENCWMKATDNTSLEDIVAFIEQCETIVTIEEDDPEFLLQEQEKTRLNKRHSIDKVLRGWVGQVARFDKQLVQRANLARKDIMERAKQDGEESVEPLRETFVDLIMRGDSDEVLIKQLREKLS
jgi:tRNA uridine 5-carbamoylmethylation protein Kti12